MNLIEYLSLSDVTQQGLADAINADNKIHGGKSITQGAIHQWKLKEDSRLAGESDQYGVPHNRVLQLVRITGGLMTKHELRPDLYDPEAAVA